MSSVDVLSAARPHRAGNGRVPSLVFPREHGAWGILLVPLVTGAWVGYASGGTEIAPLVAFTVAALTLFLLRTPVESWLGTTPLKAQTPVERQAVLGFILGYSAIALGALALLFIMLPDKGLLALGGIAAGAFLAQAWVRRWGRAARMPAQIAGAVGLTSTAAGAYFAATGRLDATAAMLWMINWLFAGNQIHYVQLRLQAARVEDRRQKLARGRNFLVGQFVLLTLLLNALWVGWITAGIAVAFVPVLARGLAWFGQRPAPLAVHRLGFTELAHNLAFGALLIAAFCIPL